MSNRVVLTLVLALTSCRGSALKDFVGDVARILCSCSLESDVEECKNSVESELSGSIMKSCEYNTQYFDECLYTLEQRAELFKEKVSYGECLQYTAPEGVSILALCPKVCTPPEEYDTSSF